MPISDKLINQLPEDNSSAEDLLGEEGLLKQRTKRIDERALDAIESLNASRRKVTKTRKSFLNDESVMKRLYLALHDISHEVDDADSRLETSDESVYDPIW